MAEAELGPGIAVPLGSEGPWQGCPEPALGKGAHDDVAHDSKQVEDEAEHENVERKSPEPAAHASPYRFPAPMVAATTMRRRSRMMTSSAAAWNSPMITAMADAYDMLNI